MTNERISEKNQSKKGSIFLLMILIFMLLSALALVITANILSRRKESMDYLTKIKIYYLAEAANAIARNSLINEENFVKWKNIRNEKLNNALINAKVITLDNHLWKVESAAQDASGKIKSKIINVVRPDFDYAIFSSMLITSVPLHSLSILGDIYAKNINSQKGKAIPNEEFFIDKSYYENLLNSSKLIPLNKDFHFSKENKQLEGIFFISEDLKISNIKLKGSIISLKNDIEIKGNSQLKAEGNYPNLLSFDGDIILKGENEGISIQGLIYGNNVYLKGNLKIKGAIFAKNKITIEKASNNKEIEIIFDERVLQTKGLHLKWKKLKNLSWESSQFATR